MSLESPETYGEQYWAPQVDAQKLFEEEIEKSLAPFIPSLFADPEIREAVPFDVLAKLEGLLAFEHPGLGAIGGRFVSEVADQLVGTVMTPASRSLQYAANRKFPNLRMSPDTAIGLFRRKLLAQEDFDRRFQESGYSDAEQTLLLDASAPFPVLPDLFRWARYHGAPDNVWGTLVDEYQLDAKTYKFWDWLGKQQLSTDQITRLWRWGKSLDGEADTRLMEVGWDRLKAPLIRELSFLVPNAQLLLQADLFQQQDTNTILEDLGKADIHPDYRQHYIDAVLIKPSASDLVAYHLRQENRLANLDDDLTRTGIHPQYFEVYHTLADRIPPLPDIISMAVREAFSPEIARRFGQYEDFPKEFARYAQMQGMSEEWAERYWAAHWGLPSPQQGFEMLHRGIIDQRDLQLLLKAQDVMPYWREKLIQMAYKPITRVDVRRMYREGVFDERDVLQAYLNVGYDDDNAAALTEFTIRQTLSAMAKFSSTDIVKAFASRIIGKSEASALLRMLGTRSDDASYILSTAEYKREWDLTDARIGAIRNLYKRDEYNENQARSELLRLNLPSDQVDVLMEQWWFEAKEDKPPTWTKAETIKYFKSKLITEERARDELQRMGYDQEHIDIYIKAITWQPPNELETT